MANNRKNLESIIRHTLHVDAKNGCILIPREQAETTIIHCADIDDAKRHIDNISKSRMCTLDVSQCTLDVIAEQYKLKKF